MEAALEYQAKNGRRLGEALLELGLIAEEQLLPFLHRQLGLPAVRLREAWSTPTPCDCVPGTIAERLVALPMFKVRDTLCVAMAEPQNLMLIDEIEQVTGLRVRPVFACRATSSG